MKKPVRVAASLAALSFSLSFSLCFSQDTLYFEPFPYVDGTTTGPGSPAKWTRDISGGSFGTGDHFEVRNNKFQGNDVDGEVVWLSQWIDVATFSDVIISGSFEEQGADNGQDYIRAFYKLGANEPEVAWFNPANQEFGSTTASLNIDGSNDSLRLIIRVNNNSSLEFHRFDDILVTGIPPCGTVAGNASISESSIPHNQTVTLTLAGHSGTVQWQQSADNINFSDIAGATTTPFTTASLAGPETYYFRAKVTDLCPAFSDTVSVTVSAPPAICVTNTNDAGLGSLRQAIIDANGMIGQTVSFCLPGIPPHTIILSTPLPAVTKDFTVIDGRTQPDNGFTGPGPKIIVNGNGITGNGITVADDNVSIHGIGITGFNGNGIDASTGTVDFLLAEQCMISNNTGHGIFCNNVDNSTIKDNLIGTDASGVTGQGNQGDGIRLINGCTANTIEGNVISANGGDGIHLANDADDNVIKGNKIGTDGSGTADLGNATHGIFIQGPTSRSNTIGGSGVNEGNVIAFNGLAAVTVDAQGGTSTDMNRISRNSMFCNGGAGGIELVNNGNDGVVAPVIASVTPSLVFGIAIPNATIEVFSDDTCANCEGADFLGSTVSDGVGNWSLTGFFPGRVTATATNTESGTSGFAECAAVPEFVAGTIYFKIKDDSFIEILPFHNSSSGADLPPDIDSLVERFGITEIFKPFHRAADAKLQRTYQTIFTEADSVNQLIGALQQLDYVEYAEKVPAVFTSVVPNDPLFGLQLHLPVIRFDQATNIRLGNPSVIVAIVDNEIRTDHEDLTNVLWINPGEIPGNGQDDDGNGFVDDINGWDFGDNDNNSNAPATWLPNDDHGTHVAGIAAAETNNNVGIASIGSGISIMALKATGDNDFPFAIVKGYEALAYAIENGADVVNMSWGSPGQSITQQNLINYGHSRGVIFVAAAGNESKNTQRFPAAYDHVIAVAATDNNDIIAPFSNFGTQIDVAAPGVSIHSTRFNTQSAYGNKSGTSMATPLVSGLCGLLLSYNSHLNPDEVENCIVTTADNIDGLNPGFAGLLGSGRINAEAALLCLQTPPESDFRAENTNVCTGSSVQFFSQGKGLLQLAHEWVFEGGTPGTSTDENPTVTYNTPGIYKVSLTLTNLLGADIEEKLQYIFVSDCNPIANEQANWYFGWSAALEFQSGIGTPSLPSRIRSNEACASVSDVAGNLLFYTDGREVFDRQHNVMPVSGGGFLNGSPNNPGSGSATQGVLIVHSPADASQYYIFTVSDIDNNATIKNGLTYYIVDLDFDLVNFPNGTVITPAQGVSPANNYSTTEHLAAIPDCDGTGFWIIVHGGDRTLAGTIVADINRRLLAYHLTTAGLANIPVISDAFEVPSAPIPNNWIGQIDISSDGNKVAITDAGKNQTHLYNFDRTTGTFEPIATLPNGNYGVCFSPNASKLYVTSGTSIVQYDLTIINRCSISNPITVGQVSSNNIFVSMQLGPDSRIYVTEPFTHTMSIIHFPDNSALNNTCGFNPGSIEMNPLQQIVRGGLPNMIDARPVPLPVDFTFCERLCGEVLFENLTCGTSYVWDFDNSNMPGQFTSADRNPVFAYTSAGTYSVCLTVTGVNAGQVCKDVTVGTLPAVTISSTGEDCPGRGDGRTTATPSGGLAPYSYLWSDANSQTSATATGLSEGKYSVSVTDANGCTVTVQATVGLLNAQCPAICPSLLGTLIGTGIGSSAQTSSQLTALLGNPVFSDFTVSGTFTVDNNFTFSGSRLQMGPGAAIVIASGNTLTITGAASLFACTELWGSITVQSGANLILDGASSVEDAETAIISDNGGAYTISNTFLNKNHVHLLVQNFAGPLHAGTITGTSLTCAASANSPGNTLKTPRTGERTAIGIEIINVQKIQIGQAGAGLTNTFDNAAFGIVARESNADVYNNRFQNIAQLVPDPSADCVPPLSPFCSEPFGTAVRLYDVVSIGNRLNLGLDIADGGNTFDHCHTGVLIDGGEETSSMVALNNTFIQPGFRAFEVKQGTFIRVENNTILDFSGVALNYLNPSPPPNQHFLNIAGNSFSGTGLPNTSAIRVSQTGMAPAIVRVENNTITNAREGIMATGLIPASAQALNITGNLIFSIPVFGSTMPSFGIKVTSCPKMRLLSNTIERDATAGGEPNQRRISGIDVEMSSDALIENNSVTWCGVGIRVFGSMPNSQLRCNLMHQCNEGLLLDNVTSLAAQGSQTSPADDIWLVNITTDATRIGGSPPDYYHRTSDFPPDLTPGNFVPQVEVPPGIALNEIPANTGIPYDCTVNIPVQPPSPAVLSVMADGGPQSESFEEESRYHAQCYLYRHLQESDSLLHTGNPDDSVFIAFHDSASTSCIASLLRVHALAMDSNMAGAILENNALIPGNSMEANEQVWNDIFLNAIAQSNMTFSPQQIADLEYLSYLCPITGGRAVYHARVLFEIATDSARDYSAVVCEEQSGAAKRYIHKDGLHKSITKDIVLQLRPNPVSGQAVLEYDLAGSSTASVSIYDVLGREQLTLRLEAERGNIVMSTDRLNPGVYYLSLTTGNRTPRTIRFVVRR